MKDSTYLSYEERQQELQKLHKLASALDSSMRLPGGFRIGLDGFIGLIPVVGDGLTTLISSYIVLRGAQLGVPTHRLTGMLLNIALETAVGVIPLVGNVFDFVWKANDKNMLLIERHMPAQSPRKSANRRLSMAVLLLLGGFLALMAVLIVLGFKLLFALVSMLPG